MSWLPKLLLLLEAAGLHCCAINNCTVIVWRREHGSIMSVGAAAINERGHIPQSMTPMQVMLMSQSACSSGSMPPMQVMLMSQST